MHINAIPQITAASAIPNITFPPYNAGQLPCPDGKQVAMGGLVKTQGNLVCSSPT